MIKSLRQKLWKLSVTGLDGPALSGEERELLSESPPAGIILFSRNVTGLNQLISLTTELRRLIPDLLIMADHEGGIISVLADAAGVPPSQMAAGSAEDRELRAEVYRETAGRLNYCGINTLLGPVADVNTEILNPVIGTRAFPGPASGVSGLVKEAVRYYGEEGVITCLKHFPGHGGTAADSHLTLPRVPPLSSPAGRNALEPFASGIEEGAEMVMTGHLRTGESPVPASMDRKVIGCLRNEMGFRGVVITDALEMGGAVERSGGIGGSVSISSEALVAGNDLLLYSAPACCAFTALGRELEEAAEGVIPAIRGIEETAAKSLERISGLKERALIRDPGPNGREGFSDDPYMKAATAACRVYGDISPVSAPFRCRFTGERSDFLLRPAQHFIAEIMNSIGFRGADNLSAPGRASSFLEENLVSSRHSKDLMELRLDPGESGGADILFQLCRKPSARIGIEEAVGPGGIVVISEYPPELEMIPEGRAVIVTLGTFPAAARAVLKILSLESNQR